ncbi:MAG TPA: sigma-70 family RNA polymerase sigma factor [Fibrobacteria bacterium]|nr:sigma-70 family RNA polymerase sigma factor [Fibrobacteria bacterium]
MMRESLRELYARHHGYVWRVCWRYVQNSADADDLAHDVLLKAARGWTRFTGECAVTSWLYRVAVNHCCDHLRRRRLHEDAREACRLGPCAGEWSVHLAGPPEASGPEAAAAEVLATLRGLYEGPERHLVYLRFDRGLPQQGIARITGWPRAVIRRRLGRIVAQAASLLHAEEKKIPHPCRGGISGGVRS